MNKADFHAKCRQVALKWHEDTKNQTGFAVVCCNSETGAVEVTGWTRELDRPISWTPGCLAINNAGEMHEATGGNDYDGAQKWVQIVPLDEEPPVRLAMPAIPQQKEID